MESTSGAPPEARQRLEFSYDYIGRRIQKKVYLWNVPASSYELQSVNKFTYDQWNLVAELDVVNAPLRTYVWGQDIFGTAQAGGGIGGLLLIKEATNTHYVGYDGNGNVVALISAGTGKFSASYEYDGFGNLMRTTGNYAEQNPIRFSTKYEDRESGYVYYGYRYADPQTGRWLSRDPLDESDVNPYRYNDNDPISYIDPLGLQSRSDPPFRGAGICVRCEIDPRTGRPFGQQPPDPRQNPKLPPPVPQPGPTPVPKKGDYDYSSPNWDFAFGGVSRTYHSISLCFPNERDDLDRIWKDMYSDLERFNHFRPNFSSIRISPNGRTAHFYLDNTMLALASVPAGSIDVELVRRPERNEVYAVTTGIHPLVGVRRWRAARIVHSRYRSREFLVETEAYEQANGLLNWAGHPVASIFQDKMWENYLKNIGGHWKKTKEAIPFNYKAKFSGSSDNPLRWRLPPSLQNSRYY